MTPTFDSMMAAMEWRPVLDHAGRISYVQVPKVPTTYPSRKRLAPRWQVPAIKRRRAGGR